MNETYTAKNPQDFRDPTFTPKRDAGKFKKVDEPANQTKKDPTDPDWDKINPDIIKLCQRNGMARGCLNLYLEGHLNWMECLETIVVSLGKELLANQEILVDQRNEYLGLSKAVEEGKMVQIADKSERKAMEEKQFMIEAGQLLPEPKNKPMA